MTLASKSFSADEPVLVRGRLVFVYRLADHPVEPLVGETVLINGVGRVVAGFRKMQATLTQEPGGRPTRGWIEVEP